MTNNQSGNVLFLILIAVALFAALSYAITQSTRSGSGNAARETNTVNSAAFVQYPVSVKTAILRMTIGGIDVQDLEFNPPSDFGSCTGNGERCVFHPNGGGATFLNPPEDILAPSFPSFDWVYLLDDVEIEGVGLSGPGSTGDDLTMFLFIDADICDQINERLGISATPVFSSAEVSEEILVDQAPSGTPIGPSHHGSVSDTDQLFGKVQGCYRENGLGLQDSIYYHVLVEQ